MSTRIASRWSPFARRASLVVLAFVALAVSSSSALAATRCREIKGRVTVQPLVGPECLSPVGFCVRGTLQGDVDADFIGTADSFAPVNNAPAFLYTTNAVIHTQRGDVMTRGVGVTNAGGDFSELQTITSGSGQLTGASGTLRIIGTPTADGSSQGVYAGMVCLP